MPSADYSKKLKAFSVKLTNISTAFSWISLHVFMPRPFKIISFIEPMPGTFLIGTSLRNDKISSSVNPRYVEPSGLFTPHTILARKRLHAIPQEAVNPVASFIYARIRLAIKILPS
jgi:hypothetical protein